MEADHWFWKVGKILEAMEITSDATRIRLAAFQLEVGLGQSLEEFRGNDIGRVLRALHGKIFLGICTTCKS